MVKYAYYEIRYGILQIGYDDDVLTNIKVVKKYDGNNLRNELTDKTFNEINEYILGKRKSFDIPFKLNGSEFQMKVWNQLLNIPYGEKTTYKEIAKSIGNEKAFRAVGMANNKNPLLIIVPCHRVIGSSGDLVGYAGGMEMKMDLLNIEKVNSQIITDL